MDGRGHVRSVYRNCSRAECRCRPTRRVARGHGFSQTTTTHHFYLTQTGGIIQVTAIAVAAEGVLATALFVLLYEEATLRRKFGVEYEEYCRNVRRRVPRMRAWGP